MGYPYPYFCLCAFLGPSVGTYDGYRVEGLEDLGAFSHRGPS